VHPQLFSSLNRKLAWATSVEIKASRQSEVSAWLRFVADMHHKHPDTAIIGFRLTDSAADKTRTPGPGENKAGAVRTVL
jgi:hypothetical protein